MRSLLNSRPDDFQPFLRCRTGRWRICGRVGRVAGRRRRYASSFSPLHRRWPGAEFSLGPDRRHRGHQSRHPGRGAARWRFRRRLRRQRLGQRHRHHGAHLQCGRHGAQQLSPCQLGRERRRAGRRPDQPDARGAAEWDVRRRMDRRQRLPDAGLRLPPGAALGENDSAHGFVAENELVALAGGRFADVWYSKATDGSGDAYRT